MERDYKGSEKICQTWEVCPKCKQGFQHELAIELTDCLILFICENYLATHSLDSRPMLVYLITIEALQMKIIAFQTLNWGVDSQFLDEAKDTAK